MEKYSKAVSEMRSQFEKGENHPLEKYLGRLVNIHGWGGVFEVVGYSVYDLGGCRLIADATSFGGWYKLSVDDVVFKECESYLYASVNDLIN